MFSRHWIVSDLCGHDSDMVARATEKKAKKNPQLHTLVGVLSAFEVVSACDKNG